MKNGDTGKIYINDLNFEGQGIGRLENENAEERGMAVFVEGALPGEKVTFRVDKVSKNYMTAKLCSIDEKSPERAEPLCAAFEKCGGCSVMHMNYEATLLWKQKTVTDSLVRIGGFKEVKVNPVIGMEQPFNYRNKAQYPVGGVAGKSKAGFFGRFSHNIVETKSCMIQNPLADKTKEKVVFYLNKYKIAPYDEKTQRGIVRHILVKTSFAYREAMAVIVINAGKLPDEKGFIKFITGEIPELKGIFININKKKTNVILGEETRLIWGQDQLKEKIGELDFYSSPISFFQVNPAQTEKLYEKIAEYACLTGRETVFDLYCGAGTIGLYLADKAGEIVGVEQDGQAVEDADINCDANDITNAMFYCGDANKIMRQLYEKGQKADVVIVDPPRKGCERKLLELIKEMQPDKVIYVSCNPATLARDLAILTKDGMYKIDQVQPVDMFPWSAHVEVIALLTKLKSAEYIEVKIDLDEMDLTTAKSKATYDEIKQYVLDKFGFKVSQLYIVQVKRKHGIIEQSNYNVGDGKAKVPQVPKEKEKAIEDALRYFKMI